VPHIAMQIDSTRTGTRLGNKRVLLLKQRAGEQFDVLCKKQTTGLSRSLKTRLNRDK